MSFEGARDPWLSSRRSREETVMMSRSSTVTIKSVYSDEGCYHVYMSPKGSAATWGPKDSDPRNPKDPKERKFLAKNSKDSLEVRQKMAEARSERMIAYRRLLNGEQSKSMEHEFSAESVQSIIQMQAGLRGHFTREDSKSPRR